MNEENEQDSNTKTEKIIANIEPLKTISTLFTGFSLTVIVFLINPSNEQLLSQTIPAGEGLELSIYAPVINFFLGSFFLFIACDILIVITQILVKRIKLNLSKNRELLLRTMLFLSYHGIYLLIVGMVLWGTGLVIFINNFFNPIHTFYVYLVIIFLIATPLIIYFIVYIVMKVKKKRSSEKTRL